MPGCRGTPPATPPTCRSTRSRTWPRVGSGGSARSRRARPSVTSWPASVTSRGTRCSSSVRRTRRPTRSSTGSTRAASTASTFSSTTPSTRPGTSSSSSCPCCASVAGCVRRTTRASPCATGSSARVTASPNGTTAPATEAAPTSLSHQPPATPPATPRPGPSSSSAPDPEKEKTPPMTSPFPLRRTRRVVAGFAGLVLLASGLTACGAAAAEGGGTRVKGGTITYAHVQEPPCIFGGWIQQAYISRQVLDGLVTEDQDGSVKPWLATSWDVSPDGLTYTFTLKDGVKFTDGTPLDAAAVAYNFDQFENTDLNGTAKVSMDPYYKSAEAIDPTHVAIHLTQPYPQFLTLITQGYFGIESPTALKTRSKEENCEKPIGSGAFTVEKWKKGQEVIFKRNPNYTSWPSTARHEGPAYVDEIKWKFVPDGVSRYASLTTGQSDVI